MSNKIHTNIITVRTVRRVGDDEVAVANCLEEREAAHAPDAAKEPPLGVRERDRPGVALRVRLLLAHINRVHREQREALRAQLRNRVRRRPQRRVMPCNYSIIRIS